MRAGRAVKVRLHGIDCPEKKHFFGTRAKRFMSDMAFGSEVTVRIQTTDRYGRTVGVIILPDGENLNWELVSASLAWSYRKYAPDDRILKRLEAKAGLSSEVFGRIRIPYCPDNGGEANVATKKEDVSAPYHGTVESHVFHRPGCRYYNCRDCTVVLKSREEAFEAGYKPRKVYKP